MGAIPATGEVAFVVGGGERRGVVVGVCRGDRCVLKLRWSSVGFGVVEGGLWWAVLVAAGVGGCCGNLVVDGLHVGCCGGFEFVESGVSAK